MSKRGVRRTSKARPVFVDGIYCATLTEGAKTASKILLRGVKVYEIQRAANGKNKELGLNVIDLDKTVIRKCIMKAQKNNSRLLRFPPDRELLGAWA